MFQDTGIKIVMCVSLEPLQTESSTNTLIGDIEIGFSELNIWKDEYCYVSSYKLPDFLSRGRRISEVKCLQYLWDTKFIEKKENNCDTPLIEGGRLVSIYEFAHMGAVGWRASHRDSSKSYVFKCGAALISEKYMLTAAHCSRVTRYDKTVAWLEPSIVRLGDEDILREHSRRMFERDSNIPQVYHIDVDIQKFIVHDKYRSPRKYYDIALIKLELEVSFNLRIRPACLWSSYDTSSFSSVSVTGWGVDNIVNYTTTSKLQAAEINLIDSSTCDVLLDSKLNRNWNKTSEHQLCAGHLAGGIDTCQGDSGGPLQYKMNLTRSWPMYYLIGITSFGHGCGRTNMPGVYTRIASFIDWIEEYVWT